MLRYVYLGAIKTAPHQTLLRAKGLVRLPLLIISKAPYIFFQAYIHVFALGVEDD